MMKKIIDALLFQIYRLTLELLYLLLFPIIYVVLYLNSYTEAISSKHHEADILLHAASLGEINALAPLIRRLLDSGHSLVINTLTLSGKKRVQTLFPGIPVRLSPLDIGHLKKRQFAQGRHKLLLIAETEIWPNMLYAAYRQGVNVLFINARISEKSLKSYLKIKPLISASAKSVKRVLAQSKADAERFNRLLDLEAENTGNLKFALDLPDYAYSEIRQFLGLAESDKLLVWGSSRPGEEELLHEVLPELRDEVPSLKIIIAPRHPKRIGQVEAIFADEPYQLYSSFDRGSTADIIIIDSLGLLAKLYAAADLVVVGGSFFDYGGHNPLEPAFYEKAIVMGPDFKSCQDSVLALRETGAIKISAHETLAEDLLFLLKNPDLRRKMGESAKKVLTKNASVLDAQIREIEKWL